MRSEPDLGSMMKGVWAVTWRSLVFIPVMVVFGFVWLSIVICLAVLPLFVAFCLYNHFWDYALTYSGAWLLLFCTWRVFRLGRFWEWPPSYL
jgi:hypothetical protein